MQRKKQLTTPNDYLNFSFHFQLSNLFVYADGSEVYMLAKCCCSPLKILWFYLIALMTYFRKSLHSLFASFFPKAFNHPEVCTYSSFLNAFSIDICPRFFCIKGLTICTLLLFPDNKMWLIFFFFLDFVFLTEFLE